MSSIEEITDELHALAAGVERAQRLAATVDSQAREIAVRAAGAGFAGVAAGIARVRVAVSTIQAGLSSAATAVGEANSAAASVPRQATPQETIAGLAPVQHGVARARETTTTVITQLDNVRQIVSVVLHGGQPGPLLGALDAVKQVSVLLVQRSGSAQQAVEAATNQARQLGSSGN